MRKSVTTYTPGNQRLAKTMQRYLKKVRFGKRRLQKVLASLGVDEPMKKKKRLSDWKLFCKIQDECYEAERNHNLRQDLIQKDIVRRFAKAIRNEQG